MKTLKMTRRHFLKSTTMSMVMAKGGSVLAASPTQIVEYPRVGIARCRRYKFEDIKASLADIFDKIGGVQSLVKGKTVTIKINLTNVRPNPVYTLDATETIYTHPLVTLAACTLFYEYGAQKIHLVESMTRNDPVKEILNDCGYDTQLFESMAPIIEFENTKNVGTGSRYYTMPVGDQPYAFSAFDMNHRYYDTDVMVSIAKMKNHEICGITLSMKNMFGATPNAIYAEPGNERTTSAKGALHNGDRNNQMPGYISPTLNPGNPGGRIPYIIADICRARPIDLAIIDGIISMSGGEGEWNGLYVNPVCPGLLIAGRNCVCTDAVGASIMGYDPQGAGWAKPFYRAENMLQLAADRWLGANDLSQIEVVGSSIEDVRYSYIPGMKL
ncbi:MAG: DUF362 domain-containing protein [Candidatus Omnitrophica bacterium]|nr:DUF362 domain-containing protein [Candidatus Omnitrophota bacterium]